MPASWARRWPACSSRPSGFGWAFALDGVSYLAVLVALLMMDPRQIRRAPVTPRGKGQVRDGLRYVRTIPELWVPLVMMAVIGTLSYNFQTVIPLFATRDMGGSDVTFTLLMSVVSVGALLGALAAGAADERRHHGRQLGRAAVRRGDGPAHDLARIWRWRSSSASCSAWPAPPS